MSNIYRDRIVLTINSYIKEFDYLLERYKSLTNNVEEITNIENDMIKTYSTLVILSKLIESGNLPKICDYNINICGLIKDYYIYKYAFKAYTKNLKCIKNLK